jgi:hypothetical protein
MQHTVLLYPKYAFKGYLILLRGRNFHTDISITGFGKHLGNVTAKIQSHDVGIHDLFPFVFGLYGDPQQTTWFQNTP